jgi:hypothetical protein
MINQFRSWTEGLDALRARAEEVRGVVDADGTSWPKTTNLDVITIASVIDPSLKARLLPAELAQRWQAVRDDAWRASIAPHTATYVKNREFWSTVAAICEYLDEVPVPDLWGVLADHLGGAELRNGGKPTEDGPFAHFEAESYDKLWAAQRDYLAQKRGFDVPEPPPGLGMPGLHIPRATNADVLQVATYWTKVLTNARHEMGYDGVVKRWNGALADVDRFAKTGKPDAVYQKNSEFWRAALKVSIQVAVSEEAPTKFDLLVDSLKYSITHLPDTLADAGSKAVDLVADAGHAVGHVANEIGKGLFAGFGTPLLIGGGLLGLYLISRSKSEHEHAEA